MDIAEIIKSARDKYNRKREGILLHKERMKVSLDTISKFVEVAKKTKAGKELFSSYPRITIEDIFPSLIIEDLTKIDIEQYNKDSKVYEELLKCISKFKSEIIDLVSKKNTESRGVIATHKERLSVSIAGINEFIEKALETEDGKEEFSGIKACEFSTLADLDNLPTQEEYNIEYDNYIEVVNRINGFKSKKEGEILDLLRRY